MKMSVSDMNNTELVRSVLLGDVPTVNKWGSNFDIDTADAALGQVIWPVKATVQEYKFIDSAETVTVQSDSALDTDGGTGANSVEITYLTSTGTVKEIKTLSGVTPVALSSDFWGSFVVEVETTGSGNTNAGNITIKNVGGDIFTIVSAGEGRTQIAVQRIPFDKQRGIVKYIRTEYARSSVATNSANMRLKIRKADGTVVQKSDPTISSISTMHEREYKYGGIVVDPGDYVYWECISVSADNTPLRGEFDIIYIK